MVLPYITVLVFAAINNNLMARDEAMVTNTFATITAVLIGLYLVVKQTERIKKARPWVMTWLMLSLIISLISSIHMLSTPPDFFGSWILFVMSAGFFGLSTSYFAIKTGLLRE